MTPPRIPDDDTIIARFWSRVDKDGPIVSPELGPCWLWTGWRKPSGYGMFFDYRVGDDVYVHRWAYGDVPDGLVLDHLCRTRNCVNRAHLEPVTIGENVKRGDHRCRGITHCKRGHEFTPENTRVNPVTKGRLCKTCQNAWSNRRLHERKPDATYRK